jgi:phosphate:Na+ symporter
MSVIVSLMGGLGFFLYGMKLMSEGLQKVAGSKMRSILEVFTKNRVIGLLVGIFFTALIQSSNATTVMVVSFVNSGLMKLAQAPGIILGANIGTTVTGQLIAFDLADIAPLFVIIGVLMVMFVKNNLTISRLGEVILGFGILFMGISGISGALNEAKEIPAVVNALGSLTNPFLAFLVGWVATAILQSNSATVGIIMLLAREGLMGLPICLFMMLGCNIGCTMSAILASFGCKKDAKRAAMIHFLFNVVGSAVSFVILLFALTPITDAIMHMSGNDPARAVANVHTIMKVFEVAILFPFMGWIVKATYKVVPGQDEKPGDEFKLHYIGGKNIISPTTVVHDGIKEIEHMGNVAITNLKRGMDVLCNPRAELVEEIYRTESYINFMNHKITDYLVKAGEMDLPTADADLLGGLFHVVNDIERIGDHAENFADAAKRRMDDKIELSEKAQKQLNDMMEKVVRLLHYSLDMFTNKNSEHMREILSLEDEIDQDEKKLQRAHVKRLTKNKCTPEAGMIFSDTVSGLERVADHATNIAFAIMEPPVEEEDDEEEL